MGSGKLFLLLIQGPAEYVPTKRCVSSVWEWLIDHMEADFPQNILVNDENYIIRNGSFNLHNSMIIHRECARENFSNVFGLKWARIMNDNFIGPFE